MTYNQIEGLLLIFCGTYTFLLAQGVLPRHPKDPEKMAQWRKKFGRILMILSTIVVITGILQLLRVLN